MDSWRYNTSNVVLEWEATAPALIPNNNPSLAEYYLVDMSTLSSEDNCCVQHSAVNPHTYYSYSSLVLTFVLAREFGYYLMDYYLPSVLLVILSWMTFWLEPNSIPTRVSLGTSTMLTFILLSSKPGSRGDLSLLYFRTNDVWFIGCTAFIFLSLVEFAFVNCIHRQ
ncbi:pH-sensitive chloride channel 2-like, partial [Nilaparvata lugens]